ncbi:N-ethylammeline chlorohydrolase [Streptococcus pneumoniae]|nr:N-ethylammeline chlorohydrolase [Streptococcus pneumoniae]
MKIKEQTRNLAAGFSKHCFEVVDRTDEVSSKHCFEVADRTDEVSSKHRFEVADRTDEVSNKPTQGDVDVVKRFSKSIKLVFRFGSYTRVIKKKRGLSYDSND